MTAGVNSILLVEDDPSDIFLVRRAFQKAQASCQINVAKDGEEAIAYLSGTGQYSDRERYPLPIFVLLDLKLPRRSGFEVLDWLRQQPALKRLPVVILTSSRELGDINKAYDRGANSYLVKVADPTSMADLTRLIDRYWMALNEKPTCTAMVEGQQEQHE
jgi:CheY-like chemotaxis protein